MTEHARIIAALDADALTPPAREALRDLTDRNALLRASLAEMRTRIFELEQLVDRDTLTRLPNERRFMEELERTTAYARRHHVPAALVCIDLDNLRAINEIHGRLAGDAALTHVARLLEDLIRSTDLPARLGGHEFAVILRHVDPDSAILVASRLAHRIAESPLNLGAAEVRIEALVRTAIVLPGDNAGDVLQRAGHKTSPISPR